MMRGLAFVWFVFYLHLCDMYLPCRGCMRACKCSGYNWWVLNPLWRLKVPSEQAFVSTRWMGGWVGATIIVASGSRKVQNIFVQFVQGVQSGRMGALLLFSDSLKRIKMYLALCALSTQTVRLTRWIGEHLTLCTACALNGVKNVIKRRTNGGTRIRALGYVLSSATWIIIKKELQSAI